MLELGPDSPEYHKEVGRFIATTKVTDLFITGELSRHYIEEAWKENPSLHTRAFSSNGELIAFLETYLKKNDVVLIKGSNGTLEGNITSLQIIHQKVSRLILRNLGSLGYRSRKIR
jgi:UDP-N-acetylmuramyl pentapeptide synthase